MTINDGKLRSRIDANRMVWDEKSKSWKISYYDKRMFIGENNFSFSEYAKDTLIDLNFSAMDLTKESVKPEEMNFFELKEFVEKIKINGINEPRWEVKHAFQNCICM